MADAAEAEASSGTESFRTLELGMVLFVSFGYSVVSSLHDVWLGVVSHGSHSAGNDPIWAALGEIANSAPAICVLLYVLSRQGRSLRQLGLTTMWSDVPLGLALAVLSFLAPGLLRLIVSGGQHGSLVAWFAGGHWHAPGLSAQPLVPLVLVGILCGAAKEELIVRAYMMSEVLDLTGSAFLAVASSTCLQALYHLYQGRWSALSAATTFLVYSLFYWRTRRATPVVLAHFAHNLWLAR